MARVNNKGIITGSIGNISYRMLNGQSIVQSKPGRGGVKQTAATKLTATEFGVANHIGMRLRHCLFPVLQHGSDKAMHRRFSTVLLKTMQTDMIHPKGSRQLVDSDLTLLTGFEFHADSPVNEYSRVVPSWINTAGQVTITVPEFSPKVAVSHPKEASHVMLCYFITVIDSQHWLVKHEEVFKLRFGVNDPMVTATAWESAVLPLGCLVLLTEAVYFIRHNRLLDDVVLNDKTLHPARVTGAFVS